MIGSKLNGFVHPLTLAAFFLPCSQYVNWMKAGYFFFWWHFYQLFSDAEQWQSWQLPKGQRCQSH
jgi:hypothetical protein